MPLVAVVVFVPVSNPICAADDNGDVVLLFNTSAILTAAIPVSAFCITVNTVCDDNK